jgi:hypothetical protein
MCAAAAENRPEPVRCGRRAPARVPGVAVGGGELMLTGVFVAGIVVGFLIRGKLK